MAITLMLVLLLSTNDVQDKDNTCALDNTCIATGSVANPFN